MKRVIKVFIERRGCLYSVVNTPLSFRYYRGGSNKPEIGLFFAFEDKEFAHRFLTEQDMYDSTFKVLDGYKVYECEGSIVEGPKVLCSDIIGKVSTPEYDKIARVMVKDFWDQFPDISFLNHPPFSVSNAPPGTVFCSDLTILNDITSEFPKKMVPYTSLHDPILFSEFPPADKSALKK